MVQSDELTITPLLASTNVRLLPTPSFRSSY